MFMAEGMPQKTAELQAANHFRRFSASVQASEKNEQTKEKRLAKAAKQEQKGKDNDVREAAVKEKKRLAAENKARKTPVPTAAPPVQFDHNHPDYISDTESDGD